MAINIRGLKESLKGVDEVLDQVTSEELEVKDIRELSEIAGQKYKLEVVLENWNDQHQEERRLRKKVAWTILVTLLIQIFLINLSFFLIGFGWMEVEQWLATSFILAVFVEIISLTLIVLKYLFPDIAGEMIAMVKSL